MSRRDEYPLSTGQGIKSCCSSECQQGRVCPARQAQLPSAKDGLLSVAVIGAAFLAAWLVAKLAARWH